MSQHIYIGGFPGGGKRLAFEALEDQARAQHAVNVTPPRPAALPAPEPAFEECAMHEWEDGFCVTCGAVDEDEGDEEEPDPLAYELRYGRRV